MATAGVVTYHFRDKEDEANRGRARIAADGPSLQLAPRIKTVDLSSEHQCAFWATVR